MLSLNPHSRTELLRYNKLNADAFTHIYTHSYIILNVHVSSENRAIRFSFGILSAIHEWRGGERSRGWNKRKTYCKNHEMKRASKRNEVVNVCIHIHKHRMNEYAWQGMRMRIFNRTNSRQSTEQTKAKMKKTTTVKNETIQNFRQVKLEHASMIFLFLWFYLDFRNSYCDLCICTRFFLEERNFGFFSLHGYKYAERVLRKRTTEKCGQTRGLVTP